MGLAAEFFAPFFIQAGGLKLRAARFEAKTPRALCVLLNGQTEFIEKYFEVIDDLLRRGFSVATFDWRGQGGSDRLLADPRKAHIADFAQYDEDLDALMQQVVRPTASAGMKITALAHSMGGHILLRRLHRRQDEFAAAALCAPMIGIQPRGVPWWMVAAITRALNRRVPSPAFVWGMGKRDHRTLAFADQIVTSDPERYERNRRLLVAHPELGLNGPTWGWLAAALKSILELHAPGYAEAISTPALLIAASPDRVCNSQALCAFAARMPRATCLTIEGAEHEILMERDICRDQLWAAFDAFMDTHMPRR
jgi:lysophospholipase